MIRPSSFRDPAGNVFIIDGRVFRRISGTGFTVLNAFLTTDLGQKLVESGEIVKTFEVNGSFSDIAASISDEIASQSAAQFHVVEHERVWFPSYPYEWPPEMLFAAGELTLGLTQQLLEDGLSLKDATPYNILFRGPKPVFVDLLSIEKRTSGDPRWLPQGQFIRMFVLPLLMSKMFGTAAAGIFLTHRDGLEPEQVYAHASWLQRMRSPFLTTVSIPSWLGRRVNQGETKLYSGQKLMAPEKADYILRAQFRRARKLLRSVKPVQDGNSTWSSYSKTLSYSSAEFSAKTQIVKRWLETARPASVLDVGCNEGHFSQIAAESGARVVAIDLDPVVVGTTWRRAVASSLNILPLVVNIAWPIPATGWRNSEYPSFLDRATGSFEAVMMLAVVHHLLVTERIPLAEIVDLCRKLTTNYLIVEYVSKEDEMFRHLTRGRESLHADFTQESFEVAFTHSFAIVEKIQVKGNFRWLYLLRKTST